MGTTTIPYWKNKKDNVDCIVPFFLLHTGEKQLLSHIRKIQNNFVDQLRIWATIYLLLILTSMKSTLFFINLEYKWQNCARAWKYWRLS